MSSVTNHARSLFILNTPSRRVGLAGSVPAPNIHDFRHREGCDAATRSVCVTLVVGVQRYVQQLGVTTARSVDHHP
jgi:hypothetical protein